jgi:DNA-directed RNA polymerase subunit RPC12/RpoP
MKCIQCNTDNTLKDRTGNIGRCKSCNHRFVFEPTTMGSLKITDPKFKKTIDDLSVNGTLFFTQTQFAYFLDKRLRRSANAAEGIFVYLFSIALFTGLGGLLGNATMGEIALTMGLNLPPEFFFVATDLVLQGLTIWLLLLSSTSSQKDCRMRRLSAKYLRILGLMILLVGIPVTLFIVSSFILFAAVVCLGVGGIYLGRRQLARPNSSQAFLFKYQDLENWLNSWQASNGGIPQLLPPPVSQVGTATVNPDVTAYSFDRLVVCESDDVAQMLIANNFHFENNCAILSIGGYPQNIFDVTMQMLRRNPDLKVYLLHDCTISGMGLLQQLQQSEEWFKDSNLTIIDVGLTPRQVMLAKDVFIQNSIAAAQKAKDMNPAQLPGLSPDELSWLVAGNYVELASFTPQQLIQVLNRGIAGTLELLPDRDSGMSYYGGDVYATESFG